MNIIKQFIQQPFQKPYQQANTNKQIQSSNQQVSCDFPTIQNQQKQRFNFTMFNEVSSISQEQVGNNKDDIHKQKLSKRQKMLQKKEQKIKSQKNIQSSKKNDNNVKNNFGLSASHKRYNLFTEVLSSVGDKESNLEFQSPSLSIDNPNKGKHLVQLDGKSLDKKNEEQLVNKKRLSSQILYETQKKKKNELKSSINSLVSRNKALEDSLTEISKGKNGKSYKIIDLGKIDIPKNQEQLYSSLLLNYSKDFTIKMEKFEVNTRKQKHQPLAFINKKFESNLISKFYWGRRQRQMVVSVPQTGGLPPLPPKNKPKKQK